MATTSNSVLIEVGEEAIGVLVEAPKGGYTLHVVHPKLSVLQGASFRSVEAAVHAAKEGLRGLAKAS
jgi:hypothetical protein